ANESPNPFIGSPYASAVVGPPIYLKVDAPQVLTVSPINSSVTQSGLAVPFVVLTNANDPNIDNLDGKAYIAPNEVFVIPTVTLKPNTSYQVTLNGAINAVPFNRSFTMTTGL
ncbi:MAG: hypothetical protein PSV24_00595, partial [Rhodoferax sp.]|nr:hypothetical protein [Rhodoferax sp.]